MVKASTYTADLTSEWHTGGRTWRSPTSAPGEWDGGYGRDIEFAHACGGQEGREGGAGGEKAQALGKADEVSFLAYGRIVVVVRFVSAGIAHLYPHPRWCCPQPPDGEILSLSTVARSKKEEVEVGAGIVAGCTRTPTPALDFTHAYFASARLLHAPMGCVAGAKIKWPS
ncbi:hypothetical protein NLJ89_g12159 [Agrocybe chaxingu]|uniref:Uncharacterized protein n=1 Tax=Agrocybe chaxingu TaxID=84603 RepID=A0A9W8MQX6_9AGAR|nr:hypothetical protein NLJ89_g12159 [Agrocybe chaxingu]